MGPDGDFNQWPETQWSISACSSATAWTHRCVGIPGIKEQLPEPEWEFPGEEVKTADEFPEIQAICLPTPGLWIILHEAYSLACSPLNTQC